MPKRPIIFSDFDGTITDRDVIMMIMEAFAPPQWRDIVDRILDQRTLSIRDGVTQLFHLIPGSKKQEIIEFVMENVRFRPGFEAFLDFCQAQDIPFLVVSGGVDFFIEPLLAPYRDKLEIFCNQGVFTPERIDLIFPYEDATCQPCGQCACCKLKILDRYPRESHMRIAIGDSLTDLGMSKVSDRVYARARLIDYCAEEGVPVHAFETFGDIQADLSRLLLEVPPHGQAANC